MPKEELETKRMFIGIEPDEVYKTKLAKLAALGIQNSNDDWRSILAQDMHLTLLFLGDVPMVAIPYLEEIVGNIAENGQSFGLRGGRVMIMQPDEPYMIWMRFEDDRWFSQLVDDVQRACAKIGTWRPEGSRRTKFSNKTPIAHITLARMNGGRLADSLLAPFNAPPLLAKMHATRIALYESIRDAKSGELHYRILKSWTLGEKDEE